MRRFFLTLIVLVLVAYAVQRVRGFFISDEERIQAKVEEMLEGFNEAKAATCLRGLSPNWRDGQTGIARGFLARVLHGSLFQEEDPQTKRFLYRVELEEQLAIVLDPEEGERASIEMLAHFETLRDGAWSSTWRVRVEAEMKKDPDRGWEAIRTERETLWSDGRLIRGH